MSTSPSDTLGDRIEFGANIAEVANATPPDEKPSSKTTSNVPENRTALTQWSPIATYVQSAEAGNNLVGRPWSNFATRSRSAKSSLLAALRLGTGSRKQTRKGRKRLRPPAKLSLLIALRRGLPRRLLFPLRRLIEDPGFIAALPDTAIRQILRLLDPNFFLKPYKLLYEYNAPNMINHLNLTSSIKMLVMKFKSEYIPIVQSLVAHHKNLDFQKYEALLKLAQATGDGPLGTQIWEDMLKDKVKPDVIFYNSYFEALCSPSSLLSKDPQQRPWDSSERVAVYVKRRVSNMFTQMIAEGVMADTKTFALLMNAYSRAGDLRGVKTILKNVWHIDVDAIIQTDETFKSLDVHPVSALHPTPELLFTIAHIFGSHNNIAVGMRVVDHVSHRFRVPIDDGTSLELLYRTYINSRRSFRHFPWLDVDPPEVPYHSVEALGNIEGFSIQTIGNTSPSMPMGQHRLIRMFYYRRDHGAMLKAMIMFMLQYENSSSAFTLGLKIDYKAHWSIRGPETLYAFHSKTLPSHLELIRNFYLIGLWVGLLLDVKSPNLEWQRETIPDIVNLFWPYRDPRWGLDFRTSTGKVRLKRTNWDPVECQDFDLNWYLG